MAHREKRAWIMLVVSTVVYAVYVAVILNRADGHQLTATPYAALTSHESPEPSRRTRRVARIVNELPSLLQRDELFARSKQQRPLFELIESLGGSAAIEHLTEKLKFSPSVLKKLVDRQLVVISDEVVARVDRLQLPSYTGFVMPRTGSNRGSRKSFASSRFTPR